MRNSYFERFYIKDQLVVITGAAGLLGEMHAYAVAEAGGIPVLLDINKSRLEELGRKFQTAYPQNEFYTYVTDITDKCSVKKVLDDLISKGKVVYGLINNAANNPDMKNVGKGVGRLEEFDSDVWNKDLSVGLTGAFICSQIFGTHMAENKKGVIINISSDLGIIAPTQYLYEKPGLEEWQQPKKSVTISSPGKYSFTLPAQGKGK